MRRTITLPMLLAALPVVAAAHDTLESDPRNREVARASDLVPWCRAETEARATGAGRTVYQWTSSHVERANTLEVRGRLQLDGGDYEVTCRIARGAHAHYATVDIVENTR